MSGGSLLGKSLPYDYEVEWIGNMSAILPFIIDTISFVIDAEFYVNVNESSTFSLYSRHNDPWDESKTSRLVAYENGRSFFYQLFGKTNYIDKSIMNKKVHCEIGNYYIKDLQNNVYIFNNAQRTSVVVGNNKNTGLHIRGFHKLYHATYNINGVIYNYIPVVKNGIGCLYDKENNEFLYSSLSSSPLVGPRVN